jgi:hypothetical protein
MFLHTENIHGGKKIQSSRSLFYSLFFRKKEMPNTHRKTCKNIHGESGRRRGQAYVPSFTRFARRTTNTIMYIFFKHNYVHLGSQASEVTRHKHQSLCHDYKILRRPSRIVSTKKSYQEAAPARAAYGLEGPSTGCVSRPIWPVELWRQERKQNVRHLLWVNHRASEFGTFWTSPAVHRLPHGSNSALPTPSLEQMNREGKVHARMRVHGQSSMMS